MKSTNQTRRGFIKKVSGTLLTLPVAYSVFSQCTKKNPATGPDDPPGTTGQTTTIDMTQSPNTALQQVGGAVYASAAGAGNVIVHRLSQTEVAVFSSRCTHQGCTVGLPSGGTAQCPCHGSAFDGQGRVTNGPATSNLAKYPATIQGNVISVVVE